MGYEIEPCVPVVRQPRARAGWEYQEMEEGMKRKRKVRDYHVLPHPRGWAVKREGNKRATVVCWRQRTAIANARLYAISKHVEVVIHRADGTIRDSDSYGNDPRRVKDRKH